jgi:hypothetical protein
MQIIDKKKDTDVGGIIVVKWNLKK